MADGTPKIPFSQRVTNQLIEQLEKGTAPWLRPWNPDVPAVGMPVNAVTGRRYRGINVIHLMALAPNEDPRWMTYNQADKQGWQVRRGEKGTTAEYWIWEEVVKQEDGTKEVVKLDRPKPLWFKVFHASQVDGLPPYVPPARNWDPQERAEALIHASGAWIEHRHGDRAFYSPAADRIVLPERHQFAQADRYYATALHELGHWTGHASRLDRDLTGTFASESYAKEELRAEIASLMLGTELGVGHDPGQHAAYVKSWIKALRDDPREIFRAAADAEKIHGFLMAFDRHKPLEQEQQHEEAAPEPLPAAAVAREAAHEHRMEMSR
jgi:antirestriction protein ArdC